MSRVFATLAALAVVGFVARATPGVAQEFNPARTRPAAGVDEEQRVIVKFRSTSDTGRDTSRVRAQLAEDRVVTLATRTGIDIRNVRELVATLHVLDLPSGAPAAEQLARVRADAAVEYAELDRRRYLHALPNDPLYTQQWYWQANAVTPSATNAEQAWDTTTGSNGVVIAVLDTGVRFEHPDLQRAQDGGRLLPGYDFVSDVAIANDGNARDADATDPGDYVTQADLASPRFANCRVSGSSWHGTRVAGIIGARTNNSEGMAGGTWAPWILPVRVLGKCSGLDSDILAGMLWAAGFHVDGIPDNPYPAQIENLSLGSFGDCPQSYVDVIATLAARGTTVVASAGNEGGPVDAPANCGGAVGVAGLRHAGTKVGYSSLGPEVAISAPAGNCVNTGFGEPCLYSIGTAVNLGLTTPAGNGYTNQTDNYNVGTSFSAPVVAAIGGLMLSVNGNLGAVQLRNRLQEGAITPFPTSSDLGTPEVCHVPAGPNDIQPQECACTTDTCGAGMAHAPGATQAALRPIAAIAVPPAQNPGQNVSLAAGGSAAACGRTIVSYAWSIVDATGIGIVGPDQPTAVVRAPTPGNAFTVRLTVTDDAGRTDVADVRVAATISTTTAPASAGANACRAAVAPPPVTISVAPISANLQPSGTQTFAATVVNSLNTAVTWQVDGVAGGNATVGTISAAGVYTAPAAVTVATAVMVTATWSGPSGSVGTAQVNLTPTAPSSGGGGGGSTAILELLALAAVAFAGRRRRPGA